MTEANPEVLQKQIADLEQQIAAKRAELGKDTAAPYERAEVHAAVGEQIQQQMPSVTLPLAASDDSDTPSWQDPALAQQIQGLVDLAFTKGIEDAVAEVSKSGNAALIDAFHDALVDELHQELVNRQLLKGAA